MTAANIDDWRSGRLGSGGDDLEANPQRAIGQRVRTLRQRAGLTMDGLAARMTEEGFDWNPDTVNNVQTGRRRAVHVTEVPALCRILGCSPNVLFGFDGEVEEFDPRAWTPPAVKQGRPGVAVVAAVEANPPPPADEPLVPAFQPGQGQRDETDRLAGLMKVSRNAMLRRQLAVGAVLYGWWLDGRDAGTAEKG